MKKNARIASILGSAVAVCALVSGLALGVPFSQNAAVVAASAPLTDTDVVRTSVTDDGVSYEEGAVIVVPAEGASASDVARALGAIEGVEARTPEGSELAVGCVRVELDGTCTVDQAVSRLQTQAAIASAQPNYRYVCLDEPALTAPQAMGEDGPVTITRTGSASGTGAGDVALSAASTSVNDPKASEQWALSAMGVYNAWDQAKVNQGVTVAALDLGCDVSHEDLVQNLLVPYNAYNAVHGGDINDISPIVSNRNHGTHVAGIIGAGTDNGIGVAGVSYNARVLPIKVVDEAGNAYTDVLVNAYDYVLSHADEYNIRVINISMGSKVSSVPDNAFTAKIDEAWNRGIVTVAAAGNANESAGWIAPFICYPSDYTNVVSVISLEERNGSYQKAALSNYNASGHTDKEISAPGARILSTVPGNGYENVSGTSMSTPQASAVLALEFAANPSLTAQQAVDILYSTATDLGEGGFDETYGYGMVNADAAVRSAANTQGSSGAGRWKRLWGQTRYQTMQAVSQEGFTKSSWAVITTAENFPDALSASVLAGACNCPILLTQSQFLSTECSSELQRLGVTDAYIVGGTAAVSSDTERAIEALGIRVARIAGADRQETSLEVMRQAKNIGGTFDTVVVATGSSFPDSLSISPYSYASGVPILLANSAGMLSEAEVAEILATPQVNHLVIVGGTSAVSEQVEAQVAGISCERIWGNDRYLTSAEIVRWEMARGLTWAHPAIATGENYPDALAGAALAGNRRSPLVLAHAVTDVGVGLIQEAHNQVQLGYVLGGTAAVSDGIASALNIG